jgi:hypothetical protein
VRSCVLTCREMPNVENEERRLLLDGLRTRCRPGVVQREDDLCEAGPDEKRLHHL